MANENGWTEVCGSWVDEVWRVRSVVRLLYDAGLPGCCGGRGLGLWEPAGGDPPPENRQRHVLMPCGLTAVEAVGLEFLFCRFFVGAGRGRPPPENRQRHVLTPCLVVCAGTIIGTGWGPPD